MDIISTAIIAPIAMLENVVDFHSVDSHILPDLTVHLAWMREYFQLIDFGTSFDEIGAFVVCIVVVFVFGNNAALYNPF